MLVLQKLKARRSTNMHLLRAKMIMLVTICAFMGRTAALPTCDPVRQYALQGECCSLCPPGTHMRSSPSCLDPQCRACEKNEYQDKYTKEQKCTRQPYCDPNRNFDVPDHKTDKRTTCVCKEGFHCSTAECITCIPHTTCKPGQEVVSKGDGTRDTVCQKCPQGSYSDEESLDGACKKWTECGSGQNVQLSGTDTSDNICEHTRTHILAVLISVVVIAMVVAALIFCWCKGKRSNGGRKVKYCVELHLGAKMKSDRAPETEHRILCENPTDPAEKESTLPEQESAPDDEFQNTPVENEDEPLQEISTRSVALTENGNFVKQESGKGPVISRQESQSQSQSQSQSTFT